MKSSIDVLYIQLIDGPVKFNSVFTDFLPDESTSERRMLMFLNTTGFIYFSLQFLLLGIFTVKVVTSSWSMDPLSLCKVPLYP